MDTLIVVALWGLGVWGLYHLFMGRAKSRLARDRMLAVEAGEEERAGEERPEPWLEGWLTRAGIRAPGSASAFALAAGLCLVLGLGLALTLALTPALDPLREGAAGLGEGSAGLLAALVDLVPWALFVGLAAAPWLHVRRKREQRVEDIERELPVVLELLATLSESGLGFDAAFTKMLEAEQEQTPLIEEFRLFQRETMAGVPRLRSLRRLARRAAVSSLTIFCSALIQAEQVGAGFSSVLRTQADDLRGRRRDRALAKAQGLPVKLVFPLVICFLPGVFVVTLGPAFKEFFEMAQGVVTGLG